MLKRNIKLSKYGYMANPPIASAPHRLLVDPDKCIGCAVCTRQCPSQTIVMVKRETAAARQQASCQYNCPAGNDIKQFVRMLAGGASNEAAWEMLARTNPFPAVTGRICPHPCESNCNRRHLDTSLNIHCIERSLGDYAIEKGLSFKKPTRMQDKTVAVIGSGPVGMSSACQLALAGYLVTVFEQNEQAGGMLLSVIPRSKLPERVVASEIKRITELGVAIKLKTSVGKDISIAELKEQYDAVLVAIGPQDEAITGTEGEEYESLSGDLALLRSAQEGKAVFVVGGGNAAANAARAARKQGAGTVSPAIATGRNAALAIDAFFKGEQAKLPEMKEVTFKGIPLAGARHLESCAQLSVRNEPKPPAATGADAEEGAAFTQEQLASECRRCMGCGDYQAKFAGHSYFGEYCIACHNCESICPQGAVNMQSFFRIDEGRFATPHSYPENPRNGLPNPLGLPEPLPFAEIEAKLTETEKVIYRRRSTRVFKTDPVPKEMIERILEAGRFAPTAGNCQGFKFIVITDRKLIDELNSATMNFLSVFPRLWTKNNFLGRLIKNLLCLVYPNATDPRPMQVVGNLFQPQFGKQINTCFEAPCAIMVFPHRLHVSDPEVGVGIACQNMVLAAHSLGIATCYIGFVTNALNKDRKTKKKFAQVLDLEWPFDKAGMLLLLGYPAVATDGAVPREFPPVTWIEAK